jgi:hypothetical protein
MQFGSEGEKSVSTEEEGDHTRRNGRGFSACRGCPRREQKLTGVRAPLSRPFRRLGPAGVPGRAGVLGPARCWRPKFLSESDEGPHKCHVIKHLVLVLRARLPVVVQLPRLLQGAPGSEGGSIGVRVILEARGTIQCVRRPCDCDCDCDCNWPPLCAAVSLTPFSTESHRSPPTRCGSRINFAGHPISGSVWLRGVGGTGLARA